MKRRFDGLQTMVATLAGSIIFLVLFLALKWHVLVSILLALGTFWGIYLVSKPPYRVGKIKLDHLSDRTSSNHAYGSGCPLTEFASSRS